jgi:ASC-1-like (ASCH) protein
MDMIRNIQEIIRTYTRPITVEELASISNIYHVCCHLAILNQPYLDRILEGKKTIESRFTLNRVAPYKIVQPGDILFLKESAGNIKGIITVKDVNYFGDLLPGQAESLILLNQAALTVDDSFVRRKANSRYATLIHIGDIITVEPLAVAKRDRRAWVVLNERKERQLHLF